MFIILRGRFLGILYVKDLFHPRTTQHKTPWATATAYILDVSRGNSSLFDRSMNQAKSRDDTHMFETGGTQLDRRGDMVKANNDMLKEFSAKILDQGSRLTWNFLSKSFLIIHVYNSQLIFLLI